MVGGADVCKIKKMIRLMLTSMLGSMCIESKAMKHKFLTLSIFVNNKDTCYANRYSNKDVA